MPLALGGGHNVVPAPALPQVMALSASIPVVHTLRWRIDEVEPDPSPPDSQSLYSTFLI
jgi:hypothetical protein